MHTLLGEGENKHRYSAGDGKLQVSRNTVSLIKVVGESGRHYTIHNGKQQTHQAYTSLRQIVTVGSCPRYPMLYRYIWPRTLR